MGSRLPSCPLFVAIVAKLRAEPWSRIWYPTPKNRKQLCDQLTDRTYRAVMKKQKKLTSSEAAITTSEDSSVPGVR